MNTVQVTPATHPQNNNNNNYNKKLAYLTKALELKDMLYH